MEADRTLTTLFCKRPGYVSETNTNIGTNTIGEDIDIIAISAVNKTVIF